MSENKRNGGFAGKGYYIALILCAAAIGIMSYVSSRTTPPPQEAAVQETYEDVVLGTMEEENVPALATQPQTTAPSSDPTQPSAAAAPEGKKTLTTASPVAGETIVPYSMEALSYNQTTRDWRTHSGIDLAAEPGAPVRAAADGEVYTVYEDDAMGHTVVIRHRDGYTTRYASLTEDLQVSPGDTVTMGQTIGYAGDSAITETGLGSHVHFGVTHLDEPMDPAEFLSLGK